MPKLLASADPARQMGLPDWLTSLMDQAAVSPVATAVPSGGSYGGPILKSIGKRLSDLLGIEFNTPTGSGLPKRLTVGGYNPRQDSISFFGDTRAEAPRFEATPRELDTLLNKGVLAQQQPPQKATAAIQARIKAALDAASPERTDARSAGVRTPSRAR